MSENVLGYEQVSDDVSRENGWCLMGFRERGWVLDDDWGKGLMFGDVQGRGLDV